MQGAATHPSQDDQTDRRVLLQRRTARRIVVDYPASLQTVLGVVQGTISDISARGAKLIFSGKIDAGMSGRLRIEAHEVYCTVAWRDRHKCGLHFEHPLDAQALSLVLEHATEEFVPIACTEVIPMGQKRRGRLVCE